VVLAARDPAKLEAALEFIRGSHRGVAVQAMSLDLSSLSSVRSFAAEFLSDHSTLHLLINNAGVMCTPFGHTADGFETQFGTNHLGHFLLTNLLVPALVNAKMARVVNLSSAGHSMGNIDFDDPNFEHRAYDGWVAYGQSKTANILCAVSLDGRLRDRGVRAYAVHPGGIHTDLGRYMTGDDIARLTARIKESDEGSGSGGFHWKTIPQGAATTVWAATSPTLRDVGGCYCEDCSVGVPASPERAGSGYRPYALDLEAAERLWLLSERLVGQRLA
jgi:NAD(P)-dependent dehydrogenase (short-subunit alcohol dehydrogenase family)